MMELYEGAVPDGMQVCHKCDNPPCVRPDHLFIGSAKANARDRQNKGRFTPPSFQRDQHPRTKITSSQVAEIKRIAVKGHGGNLMLLAARYGVSRSTINEVINQ